MIPTTDTCASCRLPWKSNADKRLDPENRVYHETCAAWLGYLPGQQLELSKPIPPETLNGRIHALEILVGIFRVPNVQHRGDRLDAIEDATGRPHSAGDTRQRLKILEAIYGDRVNFPLAVWRLAAQLDQPGSRPDGDSLRHDVPG